jgi:site-specific recombinase XerC
LGSRTISNDRIRFALTTEAHASIGTTQIYTRVAVEEVIAGHARHHPRDRLTIP